MNRFELSDDEKTASVNGVKFTVGQDVFFTNTHSNTDIAIVGEFTKIERNGKIWFKGTSVRTGKRVYYSLELSWQLAIANRDKVSRVLKSDIPGKRDGLLFDFESVKAAAIHFFPNSSPIEAITRLFRVYVASSLPLEVICPECTEVNFIKPGNSMCDKCVADKYDENK